MIETLTGYVGITCCECSINFGMPQGFYNMRKHDGLSFYCPAGHKQHFSESEIAQLRNELKNALNSKTFYQERAEHYQQNVIKQENRARGLKGALTITKRRIANGKCPCCKKTFDDLKDHIAHNHPKYKDNNSIK